MTRASAASRLLGRLAAHPASDSDEQRALDTLRPFVAQLVAEGRDPFSRATLEGHVTASAVVLDQEGRALLLFHARLRLWVQPGGHVEPGEEDVSQAALREALEESGLSDLALERAPDGEPLLLDVDVHPIPESPKRGEPAHFHHDLCFVARTRRPDAARIDPDESHALRWVDAAALPALALDAATRRRLAKAFALPR